MKVFLLFFLLVGFFPNLGFSQNVGNCLWNMNIEGVRHATVDCYISLNQYGALVVEGNIKGPNIIFKSYTLELGTSDVKLHLYKRATTIGRSDAYFLLRPDMKTSLKSTPKEGPNKSFEYEIKFKQDTKSTNGAYTISRGSLLVVDGDYIKPAGASGSSKR